jgi:methylthioribose-1-phosphate isomerase
VAASGAVTAAPAPLAWDGRRLSLLDQTLLPHREQALVLEDAEGVAEAIRTLAVRGAPLIGVAAGYGLALAAAHDADEEAIERAARVLRAARPTAANLAWAVDRVRAAALAEPEQDRGAAARAEAEAIHREDVAASDALAAHGAEVLAGARRILTHCNTGSLAAGGRGSALAVADELHRRAPVEVLCCETRPLLQGARLTVWELERRGIPHALLVDGAAAGLIRRGEVDAVLVGFDRVAANGDVVNKVGTYGHALAARAAGIPLVAAGPTSSLDPGTATGDDVDIEERDPAEVRYAAGALVTLEGTACRNPAFDVTPAELVSALVTERGVARPVSEATVAGLAR